MSALDNVRVQQLLKIIRDGLAPGLEKFINERNDDLTRSCIISTVDHFIRDLWNRRALYDFVVVCDTTNNLPSNIDNNEMICDVFIQPNASADIVRVRTGVVGHHILNTDLYILNKETTYAAYEYAMAMLERKKC